MFDASAALFHSLVGVGETTISESVGRVHNLLIIAVIIFIFMNFFLTQNCIFLRENVKPFF